MSTKQVQKSQVSKSEIADKIKQKYVLNKTIAKSIVDDVVTQTHRHGFVLVSRKRLSYLEELEKKLKQS
ncbi:gp442 [Bacillus phage G]|uniref:Gp442 n=1 Tax=Bacillus phage G TaxID=2884420 RepID=G3MAI3_9CAUD|nr:gp442 [Bacillus phage G]AEO93700.1 gp442 [Bacillus phage G]